MLRSLRSTRFQAPPPGPARTRVISPGRASFPRDAGHLHAPPSPQAWSVGCWRQVGRRDARRWPGVNHDLAFGRGAQSRFGGRALQWPWLRGAQHVLRREEGPQGRGLPDLVSEPRLPGRGPGAAFTAERRAATLGARPSAWG